MNSVIAIIGVALGGAFLIPLVGRRGKPVADVIACVATLALFCLSLKAAALVRAHGMVVYKLGGWPPPFGIALALDGLSVFMLITINLIGFLVSLFAVDYMDSYTGRWKFYTLFLLMLAGMNGVAMTGDMFNLFVFLEIATLSSYALVAFGTGGEELEAGFKYMVMGGIASSLILMGIALLYGRASTLNMADLSLALHGTGGNGVLLFVSALFIAGFGLKAALAPFHAWLPDAHSSAPAPISALLSGVLIKTLGVYALARILFSVFGITGPLRSILMAMGALSMIVGVLLAVGQWDFKRLLAYHSISQVGYIVLGVGLGTPLGILGGLFHLFNHSIFKSLLFLNSGAMDHAVGTRDLRQMGGLKKRMPVTAVTSMIASLSISGVPPFNGFWSKLIIIVACVEARRYGYGLLAAVASLLTLASFMKVQRYAFYGKPGERASKAREVPFMMKLPMVALALVCACGGLLLLPSVSGRFLGAARDALGAGMSYASRVMAAAR